MADDSDGRFLAAAIRLGAGALGTTWPNPAVGAIVVMDGRVVGRGRTAPGGRPHAEPLALAEAGEAARGATLYVSLEPCSHVGRGGPCVDAILAAGIARVMAPIADPDPRTAGQGFAKLRAAGVEVVSGILAAEARRAHAGHIMRISRGRPHVTLKLAVSADDAIGRVGEKQVVVSGEIARRHVQALRARFDAILVGSGTVEVDDPALTSRLPGLENRSPVRVILDSAGRLGTGKQVFSGPAPTWILASDDEGKGESNLRRLNVPAGPGGLDLKAALQRLAKEGITRLLVEGGARAARSFIEADFVDEAMVFRSPVKLGGAIVPALAGLPLSALTDSSGFETIERRMFGDDCLVRRARVH